MALARLILPTALLALLGVSVAAPAARADAGAGGDDLSSKRHEVGIGVAMGTLRAGDSEVSTSGVSFSYGHRTGRWLLLAEWNPLLASFTADPDLPHPEEQAGMLQRVNLLARYSYARFRPMRDVGYDLYAEAGVAREHLAWEGGGTLTRNAAVFSLGADEIVRLGKAPGRFSVMTVFVHVRWMVTPSLASTPAPRCVASCPSTDTRDFDVGMQFVTGLSWAW